MRYSTERLDNHIAPLPCANAKSRPKPHTAPADRSTSRSEIIDSFEQEIPHLRRFARYLARDADLADDLVQDCLVRAIENLEKWRSGTNLRAWLFVIIRNLFLNKKRRQKLERTLFASSGSVPETATPSRQEGNLALKETEEALCELSGNHREVLLLVAVEGLSYEEAAGITNVSVGTIKSRVSRARSALKAKIEKRKAVALERWRLRSHLPARSGPKYRTPGDRAARAI